MRFDHAGIATRDATAAAERFGTIVDAPVVHEETSEGTGLRFVFLELENGYFELVEPVTEDSDVGEFLEEEGPGLHHVALRVEDIGSALDRARDAGVRLIHEEPVAGAWGHDIAFLHPESTGGVLLEYVA